MSVLFALKLTTPYGEYLTTVTFSEGMEIYPPDLRDMLLNPVRTQIDSDIRKWNAPAEEDTDDED